MTGLQHRREAERLLKMVWSKNKDGDTKYDETARREILDKARVHAMLAGQLEYLVNETP